MNKAASSVQVISFKLIGTLGARALFLALVSTPGAQTRGSVVLGTAAGSSAPKQSPFRAVPLGLSAQSAGNFPALLF